MKKPKRDGLTSERLLEIIRKLPEEQRQALLDQIEKNHNIEKRKHPRIPFFEEVSLYGEDEEHTDLALNISPGGVSVDTQKSFEIGQPIKMVFQTVGIETPIILDGKVVRKETGRIAVRFEKPFRFIEEIERPAVSSFKAFEGRVLEAFKIFLQESISDKYFQKVLLYKWRLRKFFIPFQRLRHYGRNHYCPVCDSHISKFLPNIINSRSDARCPVCRCLERHRLDWLFLKTKTNLFDGTPKWMLHVAPETIFESKFRKFSYLKYVTADLNKPMVMYNFDIAEIPFPEGSFDVIYCSHVLEHVPDDRKALRELFRILKPGGWALLQVPITARSTFEDPSITDPFERKRLFGQEDHVRRYGPDYKDRLEEAGFKVTVFLASDLIENEDDYYRFGIQKSRMVFFCEKV